MEATMSERTSKKPGIADYVAARRKHKDCFLDEIDRLIDWKPLEKVLRQKLKCVANAVGNPAYPPLLMFKTLLLQRWCNLSDMAVEEALCDRLSFVRFVGLSLDRDEVPDATTICRFRQSLVERNSLKRLLDKRNHQLERRGLLVREGAIVDASVVSSTRHPLKVLDVLPEDREENSGDAPDVTIRYSDDADAAWLRKGKRAYYGYKIHTATDSRDGFVLGGHTTPANQADTEECVTVLDAVGARSGESILRRQGVTTKGGTRLRHPQAWLRLLSSPIPRSGQSRTGVPAQCHGLQSEKGGPQGRLLSGRGPFGWQMPPTGRKTS